MNIVAQAPAAAPITIASGASTAAFAVIAGEPGAGLQCNLNAPGSNRLNGQPFTVRAAGYFTVPASAATLATYTSSAVPIRFALFGSNTASFAAASGNVLWTTTSQAIFSVTSATALSCDWEIEAVFNGSNASATLIGTGNSRHGTSPSAPGTGLVDTVGATTNGLSSVNFATEPPVQFACGIITAASNLLGSGATATLTNFEIEQ